MEHSASVTCLSVFSFVLAGDLSLSLLSGERPRCLSLSVSVCVCVCVCVCSPACVSVHAPVLFSHYIYIYTHTHTYIYIYIYISVCVCARLRVFPCMRRSYFLIIYIYTYIYIYIYIYIYTHIHTYTAYTREHTCISISICYHIYLCNCLPVCLSIYLSSICLHVHMSTQTHMLHTHPLLSSRCKCTCCDGSSHSLVQKDSDPGFPEPARGMQHFQNTAWLCAAHDDDTVPDSQRRQI